MQNHDQIRRQKEEIRKKIWSRMEEANIARFPRPVHGRIPNFLAAEEATKNLARLDAFRNAQTIFCCPDSPQRSVRSTILGLGKTLVMASPRLRRDLISLSGVDIKPNHYAEASTIAGAFRHGKRVGPSELKIDLKVTGSVAVTVQGGRVGKGGGYSDLEYAILREYKCIDETTSIATTVHDTQVVTSVPMDSSHDMPLDYIVTPTRVIKTETKIPRPKGINWNLLSEQQIHDMPLLRLLKKGQQFPLRYSETHDSTI